MDEPHKSIAVAVLSLCRARDEIRARMQTALEHADEDGGFADKLYNDMLDAANYLDNRAYQLTAYGKRLWKKGI